MTSFGTFIGIGLGCFFLFMLIVIFCTCYQRRAVASAQGRTTVYRGTAGGPTVVTTTALGPQYNMGATAYQPPPQAYSVSPGAPGGAATVYPQTNICTQPTAGPGIPQPNYGMPPSNYGVPPPGLATAPPPGPIGMPSSEIPQTAPPPYQEASDVNYNKQPL